jgi:hypothetical protein
MEENRIGGILDVLHWTSLADYIGYIGLTPHVRRQCGTIPIYSNKDKCTIKTCIFHGKCNASNLRLQMLLHFF